MQILQKNKFSISLGICWLSQWIEASRSGQRYLSKEVKDVNLLRKNVDYKYYYYYERTSHKIMNLIKEKLWEVRHRSRGICLYHGINDKFSKQRLFSRLRMRWQSAEKKNCSKPELVELAVKFIKVCHSSKCGRFLYSFNQRQFSDDTSLFVKVNTLDTDCNPKLSKPNLPYLQACTQRWVLGWGKRVFW